mmetsp:Transcript_4392/g.13877  ORF Transcript_4392/g.13877 Transcript_4392/m.13877 type:complete len:205 (-) Transcript_4392:54-668(-)
MPARLETVRSTCGASHAPLRVEGMRSRVSAAQARKRRNQALQPRGIANEDSHSCRKSLAAAYPSARVRCGPCCDFRRSSRRRRSRPYSSFRSLALWNSCSMPTVSDTPSGPALLAKRLPASQSSPSGTRAGCGGGGQAARARCAGVRGAMLAISSCRRCGSSQPGDGAALGALQCASTCSSRRDWLLRVERRAETRERDVYVYV